ncbi:VOC family protein [Guptibacillus algicola]|uniref:VOC family protein n=1 Tax=Guptibacillus algicola TaxID=225844 RepID=UPI001CD69592|nr:VOC family protein [Alkalihalobacillus algicola]MCA0987371.1 VOC family protein [Alkalihalobacillus algicola]
MIAKLGQVMVYVKDQDQAVTFWTEKMGFEVIAEENAGMRWIEVAPSMSAETSIVLHNKDIIAKMQPDMNLDTPSLMFFTKELDHLHEDLSLKGVKVGKIVQMGTNRVFNFADFEENYFAVGERIE